MQTLMAWADEHWDVVAIAFGVALALALGAMLSVAYNVAAIQMEPAAVEPEAPPTGPGLDPGPRWPAAPYS
jgi:hypothetical protein